MMNHNADKGRLLDDVFVEADFRNTLLGETLRRVRRRRQFRQARQVAMLVVVLGLLAVLVRNNLPRRPAAPAPLAKAAEKSYVLVRTQPLPASAIVTTSHSGLTEKFLASAPVEVVQTTTGNYRVINDDELLALVASHPAALIRTGPHSEKLVFVNPDDAKGFPVN